MVFQTRQSPTLLSHTQCSLIWQNLAFFWGEMGRLNCLGLFQTIRLGSNCQQLMTFDVIGVTLLMEAKSLVATFVKQFGHWMPKFDHDVHQFATILLGNDAHCVYVL